MNRFVSLLRGVNVSGQRTIRMADLAALYEKMGHCDVRTFLQSGNVVFSASGKPRELAGGIRLALKEVFDLEVSVLVISAKDFASIAKGNPFLSRQDIDPSFLHVTFLSSPPRDDLPEGRLPRSGDEEVLLKDGHLYLYCPHGYGRTKLTNNYFERLLKTPATTRNWRTVLALQEITS